MLSAQQIKETREFLGESQAQFGARFGVDQSTAHRWETAGPPSRGPGFILLARLVQEIADAREAAQ